VDKDGFTQPEPQNKGGFYVSRRNSVSASPTDNLRGKSMSDVDDSLGGSTGIHQYGYGTQATKEGDILWCRCTHEDRVKQLGIVSDHMQKDDQYLKQAQHQQQALGAQKLELLEAYGKSNCVYYPEKEELHICGQKQRAKWIFDATKDEIRSKCPLKLKSIEMVLDLCPQRPPAVPLRSHLFSELAKTGMGCEYLKKSKQVIYFIETAMDIKKHLGQMDGEAPILSNGRMPSSLLARRAALWSVGHIASSDTGFALLEECFAEIVQKYGETFMRKLCNVSAMETEAEMQWRKDSCIKILEITGREKIPGMTDSEATGNNGQDQKNMPRHHNSRPSNVAANLTFGIGADQISDDMNLGLNLPVAGVNPLYSATNSSGGGGGIETLLAPQSKLPRNIAGGDRINLDSLGMDIDMDDGASSTDDAFPEDPFEGAVTFATEQSNEWEEQHQDEPFTIVQYMVNLVEHCTALSIRGTCVIVLGLVSISHKGRQALRQCGWDTHTDQRTAIAVPQDPAQLFRLSSYYFAGSPAEAVDMDTQLLSQMSIENEWHDVLELISNLSNRISSKEAHANLKEKASKDAQQFASFGLLVHVLALLENYNFRLPARRFVFDLMNRAIPSNDEAWNQYDTV